jgi:hypothetical protein
VSAWHPYQPTDVKINVIESVDLYNDLLSDIRLAELNLNVLEGGGLHIALC